MTAKIDWKPAKRVTKGLKFYAPIAETVALWEVKSSRGRGVYLCEVVNVPFEVDGKVYDSDHAGHTDVFLAERILNSINGQRYGEALHAVEDDWYQALKRGTVVHYHAGFKELVRCIVVEALGGVKALQPVALVGVWHDDDLEDDAYHVKKIREGKSWRPSATCVYESPFFSRRDENVDPANMNPLTLPEPKEAP